MVLNSVFVLVLMVSGDFGPMLYVRLVLRSRIPQGHLTLHVRDYP